jgi:hypothetical protein
MIYMTDNRYRRIISQIPEHTSKNRQWRMLATTRPSLENNWLAKFFGRRDKSNCIFPSKHHETSNSIVSGQSRLENIA